MDPRVSWALFWAAYTQALIVSLVRDADGAAAAADDNDDNSLV